MRETLVQILSKALCASFTAMALPQPAHSEIAYGSVVAWGTPSSPIVTNVPAGLSNVVAVSAAGAHSLALRADGTVVAWGQSSYRQTDVPPDLTNVIAISAGIDVDLALKSDGTIVMWGSGVSPTKIPAGLNEIVAVAAGQSIAYALRKDGCVVRFVGAITLPPNWPNVRDAVGIGVKKDGDVIANQNGLLLKRDGTVTSGSLVLSNVASAAGGANAKIALLTDGTVVQWLGNSNSMPRGLSQVTAVAAGDNHVLALVNPSPAFVLQPVSQVVSRGGLAVFNTTAVGAKPFRFQWQFNGTELAGATNACLIVSNALISASGSYQCILQDSFGTATSRVAGLSVVPVCAWGPKSVPPSTWLPEALTNAIAVACGSSHSLALRADGRVVAWGDNAKGQCAVPLDLTNAVSVAGGGLHSVAARSDGSVVAWGDNTYGQTLVPSNLTNVIAVAAGPNHCLALTRNGRTISWGTGDRSSINSAGLQAGTVVRVAAGMDFSLELRDTGRVSAWGLFMSSNIDLGWTNAVEVAGATSASVAYGLMADGIVKRWPAQDLGLSNIVSIAACDKDTLVAAQVDGTVLHRGTGSALTNLPPELRNVISVAASGFYPAALNVTDHALALLGDGAPHLHHQSRNATPAVGASLSLSVMVSAAPPVSYQWRRDQEDIAGATNATLTLTEVQASMDGDYSVVISNAFGTVVASNMAVTVVPIIAWDASMQYQSRIPPDVESVTAIASGEQINACLLREGTVRAWGVLATPPEGLTNVMAIACGSYHALALKENGTVVAWGDAARAPVYVPEGLSNIIAIAAGRDVNLALTEQGSVVKWGFDTNVPAGLTNVVAIAAGYYPSLALRQDGTVVAWGRDNYNETNVPADLDHVVAIVGGHAQSMALKSDGTVAAWSLATNLPPNLSEVIAISSGGDSCGVLLENGTVLNWRWSYGQPLPPTLPRFTNVVALAMGGCNLALVSTDRAAWSPRLLAPSLSNGVFTTRVPTRSGKVYMMEYSDSLEGSHWTSMPLVAGNGRPRTLSAPAASGTQRFYRVRQW